jgi:hypothetical protein
VYILFLHMKNPDNYFYIAQNKQAMEVIIGVEGSEFRFRQALPAIESSSEYSSDDEPKKPLRLKEFKKKYGKHRK